MYTLLADVRYALGSWLKNPGFTAVAVLTLGVGIGANTAIFTIVHAVLLRSLPYKDPERLVRVTADSRGSGLEDIGTSVPELMDYRSRPGLFDQVAGVFPITANLTGGDQPERVETLIVSANYFSLLGVTAARGRVFGPKDEPKRPSSVMPCGAEPSGLIHKSSVGSSGSIRTSTRSRRDAGRVQASRHRFAEGRRSLGGVWIPGAAVRAAGARGVFSLRFAGEDDLRDLTRRIAGAD